MLNRMFRQFALWYLFRLRKSRSRRIRSLQGRYGETVEYYEEQVRLLRHDKSILNSKIELLEAELEGIYQINQRLRAEIERDIAAHARQVEVNRYATDQVVSK